MCRKHSGSLLPQNCGFPAANVSPPLSSNASFRTYQSSEGCHRGFCGTCGSPLSIQDGKEPGVVEINLGAFDEEVLCGRRDEANVWEDEHGRHVPRIGGWGRELGYPGYHIYTENEILGVTDGFEGTKYLRDRGSGSGSKGFTGRAGDLERG